MRKRERESGILCVYIHVYNYIFSMDLHVYFTTFSIIIWISIKFCLFANLFFTNCFLNLEISEISIPLKIYPIRY